jgi:hypothetical protein
MEKEKKVPQKLFVCDIYSYRKSSLTSRNAMICVARARGHPEEKRE